MVGPLSNELKIFYTDIMLVPAGLLALVTAISRAFDALTDPFMAFITDNTRTRWGRRKIYIPLGVPLSALCYWMMFAVPRGVTDPLYVAIWAGMAFGFYYIFHTIWAVPYSALGMELTPDYHDRTQIFGIRQFCSSAGMSLSFFSLTFLHRAVGQNGWFTDTRQMLFVFTGLLALQMSFFYIFPLIGVKEHEEFAKRKGAPLIPGIRRALRNYPFKIILTTMIIGSVASSIPPLLQPYFTKYVLVLPNHWRNIFSLIYVGAGFLSIPTWVWVSRKWGKLAVYIVSAIAAGTCGGIFWFVKRGMVGIMCVLEFIRGFCSGSHGVVGPAMLADVIDYDELKTGKRREAQFGVFLSILPKFISIIAATLPLVILGISGYNPAMKSLPDSSLLAIRGLFSWFPLIFQAAILIIILKYPISHAVHQKIREGVIAHQKGDNAVDPITGRTIPYLDPNAVAEDTGWFLDNFSVNELKAVVATGTAGLLNRVKIPIVRNAFICLGSAFFTIWLLKGSMSMSQMDQLKQGIGTLFIIIAGISMTVAIFHILRIRAAKKMITDPVDAETINEHLKAI